MIGLNDTQGWGEHGIAIKMINIGTTKELTTIRFDDDVQKHPLRYHVEEPKSHVILEDTEIEANMDCIATLGEPTYVFKRQLLHYTKKSNSNLLKKLRLP